MRIAVGSEAARAEAADVGAQSFCAVTECAPGVGGDEDVGGGVGVGFGGAGLEEGLDAKGVQIGDGDVHNSCGRVLFPKALPWLLIEDIDGEFAGGIDRAEDGEENERSC